MNVLQPYKYWTFILRRRQKAKGVGIRKTLSKEMYLIYWQFIFKSFLYFDAGILFSLFCCFNAGKYVPKDSSLSKLTKIVKPKYFLDSFRFNWRVVEEYYRRMVLRTSYACLRLVTASIWKLRSSYWMWHSHIPVYHLFSNDARRQRG